jgi:hypothetical protein
MAESDITLACLRTRRTTVRARRLDTPIDNDGANNGRNEHDDAPSAHGSPQTRPAFRCADTERLGFWGTGLLSRGHCRAEGRATLGHCGKAARTATLALGRLPNRIKLYPRCAQKEGTLG